MRIWHELVALAGDAFPGGVQGLGMALMVLAVVLAVLWYWFPEWVFGLAAACRRIARGLLGLRLRRRKRRRGRAAGEEEPEPETFPDPGDEDDEELPAVPASALLLSADELAAQGRFKEAVRERLRAIVRDLVERGVIAHSPGWTVTELAQMAGFAWPPAAAPLAGASDVFSRIWYGQREATADHDAAMRDYAGQVRASLDSAHRAGV